MNQNHLIDNIGLEISAENVAFTFKKILEFSRNTGKFTIGINWKSLLYTQCGSQLEFSYNERNLYYLDC